MTPRTPVVPPGMVQPVFYSAKRLTLCDSGRRTCFEFSMGGASIYVFPRVLALPRPIATSAKPNCHTLRDHTYLGSLAVRTANSCQATANQPSSTTADPGSTCSTVPSSPYPRWELSIVPPRPAIYSNRVGMNPDLPLTRLPAHNRPDRSHSV